MGMASRRSERAAADYRIAHLIRKRTVTDRGHLSSVTKLSTSGVSGIVQRLKREELIAEHHRRLFVHPNVGTLVGVELGGSYVRTAITDLRYEARVEIAERTEVDVEHDADTTLDCAADLIAQG